ncbi:MAG: DegT/DnrJ/EryC1/StrS family aminotransferase [Deltaproteobacteria bacterium]|nr:DegT/DnrJ/EryC1/StrS family aminotransferase [Deltaproteobacteria bacterium]
MIPSAGTPIKIRDILTAASTSCDLQKKVGEMIVARYAFAVNSGTTAFYIILRALKGLCDKKGLCKDEIILPAYTAPSLILPIKKAGLRYRLVDMSLDTFNMDIEKTSEATSDNTLAVLGVHMFGLPMDISGLNSRLKTQNSKLFVIDDAASSFGTKKGNNCCGALCDAGFISFNRGKNLSTVSGGIIVTDDDEFARAVSREIDGLPQPGLMARTKIALKALALSYAVRPWFYTMLRKAISKFKYTTLHEDFDSFRYTGFQEALGCSLLKRAEGIFNDREAKGLMLYEGLKNISGIRLPRLPGGWRVVFNQFPLLVEDAQKRMSVIDALLAEGLEATVLYDKSINRIYGVAGDYPNAEYMADRLVLIPVHHYVPAGSLQRAVRTIERTLNR